MNPAMAREKTNAELMRLWRRLLEINTAEAGKHLGLSPRSIEDIEQGRSRVGDVLTRLGLDALIHDAAHERDCREAALASIAEREKKSRTRKKTP
jgi:predicted transcriptional regulator